MHDRKWTPPSYFWASFQQAALWECFWVLFDIYLLECFIQVFDDVSFCVMGSRAVSNPPLTISLPDKESLV